jgi:hypothetical protein
MPQDHSFVNRVAMHFFQYSPPKAISGGEWVFKAIFGTALASK